MKLFVYFFIFLLTFSLANALYVQEFDLDNKLVTILIRFDNKENFNFILDLPKDVTKINTLLDNEAKNFELINNRVKIFGSAREIEISYNSDSYIEKAKKIYFTTEVISLLNDNLEIKVILPEGATLDKSFSKDLREISAYPTPDDITTNGKNLILTWNYNANANERFPLFIIYNEPRFNYLYIIISLVILILLGYYISKKNKKIIKTKKVKVREDIEKYLKEEEKLIVSILKQKQGQCEQATLVTLTNMSKASLSRVLSELEKRNIIFKEKKGNKNLVILKRG